MEASVIGFDLPCTVFFERLPGFLCFFVNPILLWFHRRFVVVKLIFCFIITVGDHFIIRLRILVKRRF